MDASIDGRCKADERIATGAPAMEAACERSHPFDPASSEQQRHTGARRLAGSGAVEDDLPLARDLAMPRLELVGAEVERARYDRRLRLEVQPVTNVDDHHVVTVVEHGLELLGSDARNPDPAQEALARDELPRDVSAERGRQQPDRPASETDDQVGDELELGCPVLRRCTESRTPAARKPTAGTVLTLRRGRRSLASIRTIPRETVMGTRELTSIIDIARAPILGGRS